MHRVVVSTYLLTAHTTATRGATFALGRALLAERTFQAWGTTSSGAGSATITVQVSNVNAPATGTDVDWLTLGTITLTLGTTQTTDGFASSALWRHVRGNVTAISGTGASVNLAMGE